MTISRETHSKTSRETKSIVIDCKGALAAGETIAAVGSVVQETDGSGTLTLSGAAKNAAEIKEPGRRTIAPGEGITLFAGDGYAGETYLITVQYTTTGGQDLDASVRLRVRSESA